MIVTIPFFMFTVFEIPLMFVWWSRGATDVCGSFSTISCLDAAASSVLLY